MPFVIWLISLKYALVIWEHQFHSIHNAIVKISMIMSHNDFISFLVILILKFIMKIPFPSSKQLAFL